MRADASDQLGSGHVVRCLAMANVMKDRGHEVSFLSQSLPENLAALVLQQGFALHCLPIAPSCVAESPDARWHDDASHSAAALSAMQSMVDWLVVDHYALDRRWELALRGLCHRILVIDDLANRPHECDVLLDQVCTHAASQYNGLVPDRCHLLLGGDYAMLRPEFAQARAAGTIGASAGDWRVVHFFFGTSDTPAYTIRFGRLLLENFPALKLKAAVGTSFAHIPALVALSLKHQGRLDWTQGVANMAQHMQGCGIAIGTPGMSTWERACMGLPTAHLTNSSSQTEILASLKAAGFCEWFGAIDEISDRDFVSAMTAFLHDERRLEAMREKGLTTIDGNGIPRAIDALTEMPR